MTVTRRKTRSRNAKRGSNINHQGQDNRKKNKAQELGCLGQHDDPRSEPESESESENNESESESENELVETRNGWELTVYDLKPIPKRMPKTTSDVYDLDLRLNNLDDQARVRKITRRIIFSRQKFISPYMRLERYDRPKQISPKTTPFKLLKELSWTGAHTNQVEMAIRWNTYSKEVEKTLK